MPSYALYIHGPHGRKLFSGCEAKSRKVAEETPAPLRPGERLEAVAVRSAEAKHIVADLCAMRAGECAEIAAMLPEAPEPKNKPPSVRVHIRDMIRRDIPEVLDIEHGSFDCPWPEKEFISCLRQLNCICMVAECEERVVGFMIYELHKNRIHVLNFATRPGWRRMGVGRQMMKKMTDKLSHQRRNRILLEVCEHNLDGQLFFKASGFRAVSVLRGFYDDTDADAISMCYRYGAKVTP